MELFLFTFFFPLFMFLSIDIDVYIFLTLYVRFNYWSALQPLIPYHINLLQMLYRFSVLSLALFNKLLDINPKTVKSWLITSYENSVLYGHSDFIGFDYEIEQYHDDVNHILLLSYYIFVMSTCRCSVFLLERPWMTIISGPQTHCLDQKSKYNTTVL